MEIRNIIQSPNFGMALKLKSCSRLSEALENLPNPRQAIEDIKAAGKLLGKEGEEDATKFYHVGVDVKNGKIKCEIEAAEDAYFGPFTKGEYATNKGYERSNGANIKSDRVLMIDQNDTTIAGVARYVPYGKKESFFNVWGPFGAYGNIEDLPKITQIAKLLDEVAAEKYAQNLTTNSEHLLEKAKIKDDIKDLIKEYGKV